MTQPQNDHDQPLKMYLLIRLGLWRNVSGKFLLQAQSERRPLVATRHDAPMFALLPTPKMKRGVAGLELQRLVQVQNAMYEPPNVELLATEELPKIQLSDFRKSMTGTLRDLFIDGRPHIVIKHYEIIAFCVPVPPPNGWAELNALVLDFFR